MTIEFVGRHMSSLFHNQHEYIASLRWVSREDNSTDTSTTATLVDWIEKGGVGVVGSGASEVRVYVVDPGSGRAKYLQTYADGIWTNNLLSLPTY